ncbi:transcriptional repressor [Christensenellaceae bacterium OttesenSCG-928-K19]|nr:transcriptional repressor [Christensenellaceae bacterium OttesenSCG-928-K19]
MATKRKSKKRDAIYEVLCSTKSHPNAEWVYTKLKQEIPGLSLGTVYRNLACFQKEGKAVCVGTVNGQDRFDADTSPHAHFVCQGCGSVTDLAGVKKPELPALDAKIDGYQLNFYGTCCDCLEKYAH